jgi:hypothetical protein
MMPLPRADRGTASRRRFALNPIRKHRVNSLSRTSDIRCRFARSLTAMGVRVIEVSRVNRQVRRRHGKTDTVDAEPAARSVRAGEAQGQPKSRDDGRDDSPSQDRP